MNAYDRTGVATQLGSTIQSAKPPRPANLSATCGAISQSIERIEELTKTLDQLCGRMFGSENVAHLGGEDETAEPGEFNRLVAVTEVLGRRVAVAELAAARLTTL